MGAQAARSDAGNVIDFEAAKPTASVVLVSPDIAERWLARNVRNRKIREAIVAGYARDMAAGRWELTGEAVKFSAAGALLDGQHRLSAVVKSDATVPMFVVRGLRDSAQAAMDTGSKRTASDMLGLDGEQHSALLAAASRLALADAAGRIESGGRFQPTHGEIAAFIDANPSVRDAAAFASAVARRTDCPPAYVAFTTWRLSLIDPAAAHKLWIDAAEKVGLRAGDPVIALTNRLAESRRNRERLAPAALVSMIYRTWNARRSGSTLRLLKVKSSAGGLIPIPEPK